LGDSFDLIRRNQKDHYFHPFQDFSRVIGVGQHLFKAKALTPLALSVLVGSGSAVMEAEAQILDYQNFVDIILKS
jgi:hypothetical protein